MLSHLFFHPLLNLALFSVALGLSASAQAAGIGNETHNFGTACSANKANGADWDTLFQCSDGTWKRAPYFFGTTSDTCDSAHAGLAQWSGSAFQFCNGSSWSSLVLTATGSLGIGTATPTQALHVSGNAYVTGNIYWGTGGNWLSAYLNQPVRTDNSPTFSNIYLSYLGAWLSDRLNQDLRTSASPTFWNVYLGYLGWLSDILNQSVKTNATPSFSGVNIGYEVPWNNTEINASIGSGSWTGYLQACSSTSKNILSAHCWTNYGGINKAASTAISGAYISVGNYSGDTTAIWCTVVCASIH